MAEDAPAPCAEKKVCYCEVCTLPVEYCEWDPLFGKCKEWLDGGAWKDLYPDLDEDGLAEMMTRLGFQGETDEAALKAQSGRAKVAPADGGGGGKGGGKKSDKGKVTIELSSRNKRKHLTSVRGLEAFGIDMRAAAKVFGKKFASGSAFEKGKHGQPDAIEIQGDWMHALPDFLCQKYPEVTADRIETKDSSKKKKGGGGVAAAAEEEDD